MKGIIGVVTRNGNGFTVDEPIKRQRGFERFNLLDYLLHLTLRERASVQAVYASVIVKQDLRPVIDEIPLCGIAKNASRIIPSVLLQHGDNCLFKRSLFIEDHRKPIYAIAAVMHLTTAFIIRHTHVSLEKRQLGEPVDNATTGK